MNNYGFEYIIEYYKGAKKRICVRKFIYKYACKNFIHDHIVYELLYRIYC